MLSFGGKSFLIMISGRINLSSDSLIVGYFMSAAWVPFYSIPASLINYCRTLLWSLTQSFLPLFSNLEAKKDLQAMQSIFLRYTRYTCLLIFPVLVLSIVYGEPFLRIWMGPQFADKGGAIVVLLTLALSISALQPLSGRLLTGTARQGLLVWTGFCSAWIFVFLSVLLIQAYGLSGLATAFLISTLVPAFQKARASPILVAVLAGPLVWSIKRFHYPTDYVDLVLQSATGLLIFATLGYLIALSREERVFINSFITTLRRTVLRTYWGS
jgi:O-antigen/teichoic acid export membrane protein